MRERPAHTQRMRECSSLSERKEISLSNIVLYMKDPHVEITKELCVYFCRDFLAYAQEVATRVLQEEIQKRVHGIIQMTSSYEMYYGLRMLGDIDATAELVYEILTRNSTWEWGTGVSYDFGTWLWILAIAEDIYRSRKSDSLVPYSIIAIDFHEYSLTCAKTICKKIGIDTINFLHWDLESKEYLRGLVDVYGIPDFISCELIGKRANALYEEWDAYTYVMILLHQVLQEENIHPSFTVFPHAVIGRWLASPRYEDFLRSSPDFEFSVYGVAVEGEIMGNYIHGMKLLQSFYSGDTPIEKLKRFPDIGVYGIRYFAGWPVIRLHEIGASTRWDDSRGLRRW